MKTENSSKIVLVTGSSSGIGKAITKKLANYGYKVIACSRNIGKIKEISNYIESPKELFFPYQVDLRSEKEIMNMFNSIKKNIGPINILINAAGLGYNSSLIDSSAEQWREMFDVNVIALCICNREALNHMISNNDQGHIINISSLSGHRIYKEGGIYSATKYSVTAITESLRLELRERKSNIRVSQISPGLVKTKFHEKYYNDKSISNKIYNEYDPLNGDDIAEAIIYVITQPSNVQIHDILIRPINQPG
jgi:17beta-estradiol 17-dehydrogenase / 3beta-hydroxysteroid 3-dehydrogenase